MVSYGQLRKLIYSRRVFFSVLILLVLMAKKYSSVMYLKQLMISTRNTVSYKAHDINYILSIVICLYGK